MQMDIYLPTYARVGREGNAFLELADNGLNLVILLNVQELGVQPITTARSRIARIHSLRDSGIPEYSKRA